MIGDHRHLSSLAKSGSSPASEAQSGGCLKSRSLHFYLFLIE
jgi:hypothetical protein